MKVSKSIIEEFGGSLWLVCFAIQLAKKKNRKTIYSYGLRRVIIYQYYDLIRKGTYRRLFFKIKNFTNTLHVSLHLLMSYSFLI